MKITLKKIFITAVAVNLFNLGAESQQDLTIYHMPGIQQSHYVNLSQRPDNRINIGLPVISSIYLRQQNTFLNPDILFDNTSNGVVFNTNDFRNSLRNKNFLGADAAVDLFSFGIKIGKNYASFSVRERISARVTIPGDLLNFSFTGNADFDELDNGTLDFSPLDLRLNHYREYGISLNRKFKNGFSAGVRLKYLYGMENVTIRNNDLNWRTDPVTWDHNISGQIEAYSSGFAPLITNDQNDKLDIEDGRISDYLLKRKNRGVGLDFGVGLQVTDKLNLSASVTDLGFINWKSYNKNFVSQQASFNYDGIFISENDIYADSTFTDSLEMAFNDLWESFKDEFEISENEDSYTSFLPARVYIGAEYDLFKNNLFAGSVGGLLQTEIYRGQFSPTLTLSYNQRVQNWLSASFSYSIIDWDYRNLGAGLAINSGPVQYYLVADNLLASNRTEFQFGSDSDVRIQYPSFSKNVHLHFGINVNLFRKNKEKKEGQDYSRTGYSKSKTKKNKVKPLDTDKDGVPDSIDECPEKKGKKKNKGCPDTDKDGIPDVNDKCPYIKGVLANEGCPFKDKDQDGVLDDEDECPNEHGLPENQGCPQKKEDKK